MGSFKTLKIDAIRSLVFHKAYYEQRNKEHLSLTTSLTVLQQNFRNLAS